MTVCSRAPESSLCINVGEGSRSRSERTSLGLKLKHRKIKMERVEGG